MNHTQSLYLFMLNVVMMGWNILLSVVPIILARWLNRTRSTFIQIILFLLWLIFLPNTLYMVTDIIHLFNPKFGQLTFVFQILGIWLYMIVIFLAVFTFILSIKPVLMRYRVFLDGLTRSYKLLLFSIFSLLIGFAISMGRFQRTNTWYIFTQPMRVVQDVFASLTDPTVVLLALAYSVGAFVIILLTFPRFKS